MIFIAFKIHHKGCSIARNLCAIAKLGFMIHIHAVGFWFEGVVVMSLGNDHVSTCELYCIGPGKCPYPHKCQPPNFDSFMVFEVLHVTNHHTKFV